MNDFLAIGSALVTADRPLEMSDVAAQSRTLDDVRRHGSDADHALKVVHTDLTVGEKADQL